jgi:hypothetical protein
MASRAPLANPPVQPQAQQPQPGPRKYDGKNGPKYDENFGGHYGEYILCALFARHFYGPL